MDSEEALDILYPEGTRDLTPEGYIEAISRLRFRDPNLSKRVEATIKSTLDAEYFTRSQIPWYSSSRGTEYRIALLPDNPHVRHDVGVVRSVLGIPEDQVRSSVGDSTWSTPNREQLIEEQRLIPFEDWSPEPFDAFADRALAWRWIKQHDRAHRSLEPDRFADGLTAEVLASARDSAAIVVSRIDNPDWLRAVPVPHPRCHLDDSLPLHQLVSVLLDRHRLPSHICGSVMTHICTLRLEDLSNLQPYGLRLLHGSGQVDVQQSGNTFSITVEGIDEFTTAGVWRQIWKDHILPQQQEYWGQRGQQPSGRQAPDLDRLKRGMTVYQAWFQARGTGTRVEEILSGVEMAGDPAGEMNSRTAEHLLEELRALLEPP